MAAVRHLLAFLRRVGLHLSFELRLVVGCQSSIRICRAQTAQTVGRHRAVSGTNSGPATPSRPTISFLSRGLVLLCRHRAVLVFRSPRSQIRMEYWHLTGVRPSDAK